MKFRTKLSVGFGSILFLLLILAYLSFSIVSGLNRNMNLLVKDNMTKVNLATTIRVEVYNIDREVNYLLLSDNAEEIQKHLNTIESYKYLLTQNWDAMGSSNDSALNELMASITANFTDYSKSLNQVINALQSGDKAKATDIFKDKSKLKRDQLFKGIQQFVDLHQKAMLETLNHINASYRQALQIQGALVLMILIGGALIAYWVFRSVTSSLRKVVTAMDQAQIGNPMELPRIEIKVQDEIGKIAESFNHMANVLEIHEVQMNRHQQLLEEHTLHKSTLAEVTGKFQGIRDVSQLAEMIVNVVTPMLGAHYGVFYASLDPSRLTRMASFAGIADGGAADFFELGEGLVGQCAKENIRIALQNVPSQYMRISSGLVSAVPNQVILIPIPFEGRVIAVLEFASTGRFSDSQLKLLDELAITLGIAVNNVMSNMQIQQLLNDSQLFTEELQSQSEELQLQQEELKTLNEKLEEQFKKSDRRSKELEGIRKELEDKNQQLILLDQYKTEFLANVSHELRTPLNSLLILAQMLTDNKDGNLTPKQIEQIRTIHTSGKDLLSLINEILDLSKIEAGKMDVIFENVTIQELAEYAKRQFLPIALEKEIEFSVELEDVPSDFVLHTDIPKLQQILKNLLSNAFKFTDQGSVTLLFSLIGETEKSLSIAVRDSGIGIPENKLTLIFEAFQQADGTTSRKYGGTGLGLSISKELAELLGGGISVTSEEGMGSTFTLILPADPSLTIGITAMKEAAVALETLTSDSQEAEIHTSDLQLQGKKVLLVDDDMRNIYVLTTALELKGLHVVFAENGREALDILMQTEDINLVLMDIMMPKMDGYEAIKAIRQMEKLRNLPIIALTAKSMKHDRDKCIEAGANDYIGKPIQLEQLFSLVSVWMHRQAGDA